MKLKRYKEFIDVSINSKMNESLDDIWLSVNKGEPVTYEQFHKVNTEPDVGEVTEEEFNSIKSMKIGDTLYFGGQGSVVVERVDKVAINEGWKENILGTAMAASAFAGNAANNQQQSNDKEETGTYTSYEEPVERNGDDTETLTFSDKKTATKGKTVRSKEEADDLVKKGWTLNSTQIDTIWKEVISQKPETIVNVAEIKFDNNQFFSSGKYNLNQEMKDSISAVIGDITSDGGIISAIQVESSTDKQGLSKNLQNELKDLGYSGDNTGLSKARCEKITVELETIGIDSSLITTNQIVEGGTKTIDSSARYVTIKIVYLDQEVISTPGIVDTIPEFETLYKLSKEYSTTSSKKTNKGKFKIKKTKIKKCGSPSKCFLF